VDFVNVADLGTGGFSEVLELAAAVKADRSSVAGSRPGINVGLFFEKPSLRTRVSCEVAASDLGMVPYVKDVGAVLDRYLDVLALRVFDHRNLETIAANADAPVINLLSDREHPCQALADLQTLAEARPLEGATVAFIGDGNNVCNSLMIAGAMMGVSTRVAGPVGFAPPDEMVAAARTASGDRAEIVITDDPAEAVRGADAVYTDVWASMGQEDEAAARKALFEPYRVDEDLFGLASQDAIFLHCLPAHRGDELTDAVADHERSRIYDQAENRMHAFKALLLHLT